MSYSFESRVRFSEIGEDGCLTLPGVLDYFQDCCTFESEQTGVGMEVIKGTEKSLGTFCMAGDREAISKAW